MKKFLTYTAIVEALTGLGLLIFPLPLVALLSGSPLAGGNGKIVAWIAGAAILSFAFLCYQLRSDLSARKAVVAMVMYNFVVTLIFLIGIIHQVLSGPGAWLVLVFHAFQTIYSFTLLQKKQA